MVRNIQEIKNPGGSNRFEQLVGKCLGLGHSKAPKKKVTDIAHFPRPGQIYPYTCSGLHPTNRKTPITFSYMGSSRFATHKKDKSPICANCGWSSFQAYIVTVGQGEVKFWTSLSVVWNWKTPISSATAVGSPDLPTFPKSDRFPWTMTWSSDLNFLDKILSTFLLQLFDPLTLSGYVNKTWNPWFQTPIW